MKTSVVIVTYNGEPWLRRCLQSVCDSSVSTEVIVVDNNSTDRTLNILDEFQNAIVLKQTHNLGFGKANNIGISYAINHHSDYVFLLNQDAYLDTSTLKQLINVHKSHPNFGILSPIHLSGNGEELDYNFSNYLQKNKSLVFDALKNNYTKVIYEVPFVNAAGWLLPTQVLLNIGGFDPIFEHYGEDVNYCERLRYHGYKIGIVPKTYLYHDRAERQQKNVLTVNEKLNVIERKLKVIWGNINQANHNFANKEKRKLWKAIFKSGLQLKFKSLAFHWKKLHLIKQIELEIEKSRTLNKQTKPNYLNLGRNKK